MLLTAAFVHLSRAMWGLATGCKPFVGWTGSFPGHFFSFFVNWACLFLSRSTWHLSHLKSLIRFKETMKLIATAAVCHMIHRFQLKNWKKMRAFCRLCKLTFVKSWWFLFSFFSYPVAPASTFLIFIFKADGQKHNFNPNYIDVKIQRKGKGHAKINKNWL